MKYAVLILVIGLAGCTTTQPERRIDNMKWRKYQGMERCEKAEMNGREYKKCYDKDGQET